MKFKTFRYWLASKILGALIIEEVILKDEKAKWVKEQLDMGNSVTMDYSINRIH